jgi:chlorobactene glucosyltransferase
MTILLIFVACALIVMTLTAISNVFALPRLRQADKPDEQPLVSMLVPARNEARVIEETVRHLLAQTYPHFELLVLDDNSTDGTGELASGASAGDARFKLIAGTPLPEGWTGKNHACHILAQHASGEILVFTDADTRWQPDALAALMAFMARSKADMATVWSTQTTITPTERIVVPLMMLAIIAYLPIFMTHYAPFAVFAAANGQCMAWRRDAYQHIGGHTGVASSVLEDVQLARIAKREKLRLRLADGAGLIGCRMYMNWREVRDGFAKNILAGYGNSVAALLLATMFHLLVFIAPYIWLGMPAYQAWAVCFITLGIGVRALSAAVTRQRVLDALTLPIGVLLMTCIALQAIYWRYTGGARWKGRIIHPNTTRNAAHG